MPWVFVISQLLLQLYSENINYPRLNFRSNHSITHHSKQYYVRLTLVSFFQFIYWSTHEYVLVINVFNNKEVQRIKSENLPYSFTSPPPCPPHSSTLLIRSILNYHLVVCFSRHFSMFIYIWHVLLSGGFLITYDTITVYIPHHIHFVLQLAFLHNNMLGKSCHIRIYYMLFNHYIAFQINHSSMDEYLDCFFFFMMLQLIPSVIYLNAHTGVCRRDI